MYIGVPAMMPLCEMLAEIIPSGGENVAGCGRETWQLRFQLETTEMPVAPTVHHSALNAHQGC
jgi:hypothetical protein